MRILTALLIGTLLFVTACGGDDGNENATSEPAPTVAEATVALPTPEAATPAIEDSSAITESSAMTDTGMMDSGESMTATESMSDTSTVSETGVMTATGETDAPMAVATLLDADGNAVGDATFTETEEGVMIQVTLREFTAAAEGEHGIHIHTTGACTPDFQAAGGHFNPTDAQHGMENSAGPHSGDLPNLEVDADGNAVYEATDTMITLGDGEGSLFDEDGSALVLHADPDDMVTDPSGNSGDRIACGVIEMQ